MPARKARTQKRSPKTIGRQTDEPKKTYPAAIKARELERNITLIHVKEFIERFPSLKNSSLAIQWGKISLSDHLSDAEVTVGLIGILHKAFYAAKTSKEKKQVLNEIHDLTSASQTQNFNLRHYHQRRRP
ncbi:MAG: hypothetical protein Q7S21_00490 [archaeon]|nr:hypothetical protein [archaeon]